MEHRGFEPLTSTMRTLRATNCANAPYNGWQPFDCQPFGLGERIRTSGLLNPIRKLKLHFMLLLLHILHFLGD